MKFKVNKKFFTILNREIENSLDKSAEILKKSSKNIVAVDTGKLRDSIDVKEKSKGKRIIGSEEKYAGVIEYGSRNRSAQPYFRPALKKEKENIKRAWITKK